MTPGEKTDIEIIMVHVPPARTARIAFGRLRDMAEALGIQTRLVKRWCYESDNGLIPSRWHVPILKAAAERGVKLTPHDLIYGSDRLTVVMKDGQPKQAVELR